MKTGWSLGMWESPKNAQPGGATHAQYTEGSQWGWGVKRGPTADLCPVPYEQLITSMVYDAVPLIGITDTL